jgi:hypothetical protein
MAECSAGDGSSVSVLEDYMNESPSKREGLLRELEELDARIQQERDSYKWGVGARIGHRHLQLYLPVRSGLIFAVYIIFNTAVLAAGIALILGKGVLKDLGVAMVVGALFAFGSFAAQWWTVQVQFERDVDDRIYGSIGEQQHLGEMRTRILRKLNQLSQSGESDK